MEKSLQFLAIPRVVIATNTFECPIVIRYKSLPMLEMVQEVSMMFTPRIPIFHSDGTKLAVAKGAQLHRTKEGESAGVEMRHLPDHTICELNGEPIFEMRRDGAAALKMNAGLHTNDGVFLEWSDERIGSLVLSESGSLKIAGSTIMHCEFKGAVGIQIGEGPAGGPGAALGINL